VNSLPVDSRFNEYDNWQASGVSGQGARRVLLPKSPMNCADCHMPQVPSGDDGNVNGLVHSLVSLERIRLCPPRNQDQAQYEFAKKKKLFAGQQLSGGYFRDISGGKANAPARNEMASRNFRRLFACWAKI